LGREEGPRAFPQARLSAFFGSTTAVRYGCACVECLQGVAFLTLRG
jgi:hypothetical protein